MTPARAAVAPRHLTPTLEFAALAAISAHSTNQGRYEAAAFRLKNPARATRYEPEAKAMPPTAWPIRLSPIRRSRSTIPAPAKTRCARTSSPSPQPPLSNQVEGSRPPRDELEERRPPVQDVAAGQHRPKQGDRTERDQ